MNFEITNKEGEVVPTSKLEQEAAAFWGKPLTNTYYAHPGSVLTKSGISWVDTIGRAINRPAVSNMFSKWTRVRLSLLTVHMEDFVKDITRENVESINGKMQSVAQFLNPYFKLIEHWEQKGYQPQFKD